jgi:hypothetical protein
MKYEAPKYEFPVEWRDWCTGAGQPAGIWWLEGRTYYAGFGSLAEARLVEAGAFHVATLQFEPDPLEAAPRAGRVVPLSDSVALQLFSA